MTPSSPAPPDLLELAHLAFLRGHLEHARSLLDRLVLAEPDNGPAQDLRATVIGKQAAILEAVRLQTGDSLGAAPPARAGSVWTRPLVDPATALLNSPSARTWPKPLLLAACLLAGVLTLLFPGRHHHGYFRSSWTVDIAFGLAAGLVLFVWMLKKR